MQEHNIPRSAAPWDRPAKCLRPRFRVARQWSLPEWPSSGITLVYFNLESALLWTCLWAPVLVVSHPLDILILVSSRNLQINTPKPKPWSSSPKPASSPSLCASTEDTLTPAHPVPLPAAPPSPLSIWAATAVPFFPFALTTTALPPMCSCNNRALTGLLISHYPP